MTDVEKAGQEKMEKTFVSDGSNTPEGTVVTRVVSQDGEGVVVPQHQHEFSLLSAVGLAFAILNSWTAMAASLSLALPSGGPTSVIWGVIVSGIGNLCIAASLAEICHVYTTSGGQYHWAYVLSPPAWAPLISWIAGWFSVAGWWALVATGGSLAGQLITGVIALLHDDYVLKRWHIFVIYTVFVVGACILNIFCVRYLPLVDRAALFWSLAGVTTISITVLACRSDGGYQDASFVFGKYINESGWNGGVAWILGLLQSAFGLTAYDSVSHLVEEMPNASINAPKAMVLAVAIGTVSSFIFLVVLLFCLTDVNVVNSSSAGALGEILYQATSSKAGAVCLLMFPIVCMAFATQSILTTSSRMTQAFARDGGLPYSAFFARQNARFGVPFNSIILATILVIIFGVLEVGSSSALNAILSSSVVGLNVSYSIPIFLLLVRGRRLLELPGNPPRKFDLGPIFGPICNIVGLAFAAITTIFFFFPPDLPVDANNMNYTCVVFAIVGFVSTITWYTDGRKNFKGPRGMDKLMAAIKEQHWADNKTGIVQSEKI